MTHELTIVTAITGDFDFLKCQPPQNAKYVAFVDKFPKDYPPNWTLKELPYGEGMTPRLRAKIPKILMHDVVDTPYSLWIDASIVIKDGVDILELAKEVTKENDIAIFPHKARGCVYAEAFECAKRNLDDPSILFKQCSDYHSEGYPFSNGLHEASIIFRRHTKAARDFNISWWEEVNKHSIRDQVSLEYSAWKTNTPISPISGFVCHNNWFQKYIKLDDAVSIGPIMDRPSWQWVGINLYKELSKTHAVKIGTNGRVKLAIKEPLKGDNVIYFPLDHYETKEELENDPLLPHYKAVGCHSEVLMDFIKPINSNVFFIEHDNEYVTKEIQPRRNNSFVLWVGFSKYLKFLDEWAYKKPLKITALTNKIVDLKSSNITQEIWTREKHLKYLTECSAAVDVKGDDFSQRTKPLEKLKGYLASGIPTYFNDRFFDYKESIAMAHVLRPQMESKAIGDTVRAYL